VRLCSFQPTDICARLRVLSQVLTRAYERKEDSDDIARFFLRPVATSVHIRLKNADQVQRQEDAFVPRQE